MFRNKLTWEDFEKALGQDIVIGMGGSKDNKGKWLVYVPLLDKYELYHGGEAIAALWGGSTKSEEIQKLLQQYNDL